MCKYITLEELLELLSITNEKIEKLSSKANGCNKLPFNFETDMRNLYIEKEVLNKLIDYISLKNIPKTKE